MRAHGWAVIDNGEIKVRTVSDTRRAAIVNFLITDRGTVVTASAQDQDIERAWIELRQTARTMQVIIETNEGS